LPIGESLRDLLLPRIVDGIQVRAMTNFASRRTLGRTGVAAGRAMTTMTQDMFRRVLAAAYDLHRHRDIPSEAHPAPPPWKSHAAWGA
jgi:hypothetical protein